MSKLKELAIKDLLSITTTCPYSEKILRQMDEDYKVLSPANFSKKYRYLIFSPSSIVENSSSTELQLNYCTNPFCSCFGLEQEKYINIKGKPSRYRLVAIRNSSDRNIFCNNNAVNTGNSISMNCYTDTVSNWSVAEEIKRLKVINKVINKNVEYKFHKDNCTHKDYNPFENAKEFHNRGKSTGNAKKYQCKECKKITNVLPSLEENYSYNQKKNDILPLFIELLVSRTPVKRSCEILKISPKTYYHKLEWLYRKCLEFLDRHETKAISQVTFDEIWLNSDKMIYYLNNVRRKGKGGLNYDNNESRFQTSLIASSDITSRYVFRADIAYDYSISQEEIEKDTLLYHDDHLYSFARKNERLRFPYSPQPPTINDDETFEEYETLLAEFERRKDYIEGIHTNSKYTAIAHFYLIKEMIKSKRWNFVSDEDAVIIDSVMRIFSESIKKKDSHYFLCKIDRNLTKREAYRLCMEARKQVKFWIRDNGREGMALYEAHKEMLSQQLDTHYIYDYVKADGKFYPKRGRNPLNHPAPSIDEGVRYVDCITNLSDKSNDVIADYLVRVNSHSISTFFNQIRRRLSILERPLVTARGDGKSYIYSNYNPKYAQYSITILRTLYNFCWTFKSKDGEALTPAQRLGITNKVFKYKDIIYFS